MISVASTPTSADSHRGLASEPITSLRRAEQDQRDEGERNAEREHHLAEHERVGRVDARRRSRSAPAPG